MKVAVLISGQLRSFECAYETQKIFLNQYDCDYFIFCPKNDIIKSNYADGQNKYSRNLTEEYIYSIYKEKIKILKFEEDNLPLFNNKINQRMLELRELYSSIKIEEDAAYNFKYNMNRIYLEKDNYIKSYIIQDICFNMCFEFMEEYMLLNNIKYDIVIRLRPDLFLLKNVTLKNCIEGIKNGYVYGPITSWVVYFFLVANFDIMKIISNAYKKMGSYINQKDEYNVACEGQMMSYFKEENLKFLNFPYMYYFSHSTGQLCFLQKHPNKEFITEINELFSIIEKKYDNFYVIPFRKINIFYLYFSNEN